MKGSQRNAGQSFIYRCCNYRPITDGLNTGLRLDTGNEVSLEKVDKFCYLLDADGGCDLAVTTRVRSAWKKLPILTGKGFSLKLKDKVYATCVRSCLVHDSETWPMKVEHKSH